MTAGIARHVERLMITEAILKEVEGERRRQDNKWGEQNHDPFKWLAILGEEVGESCRAVIEAWSSKDSTGERRWRDEAWLKACRAELIQVAAVAVAMVECLDRDQWPRS